MTLPYGKLAGRRSRRVSDKMYKMRRFMTARSEMLASFLTGGLEIAKRF